MMPTYTYTSGAFERDDIELVKMFLSRFKDADGRSYTLKARLDLEERKEKAIEAIAVADDGHALAVERRAPATGEKIDKSNPNVMLLCELASKGVDDGEAMERLSVA